MMSEKEKAQARRDSGFFMIASYHIKAATKYRELVFFRGYDYGRPQCAMCHDR